MTTITPSEPRFSPSTYSLRFIPAGLHLQTIGFLLIAGEATAAEIAEWGCSGTEHVNPDGTPKENFQAFLSKAETAVYNYLQPVYHEDSETTYRLKPDFLARYTGAPRSAWADTPAGRFSVSTAIDEFLIAVRADSLSNMASFERAHFAELLDVAGDVSLGMLTPAHIEAARQSIQACKPNPKRRIQVGAQDSRRRLQALAEFLKWGNGEYSWDSAQWRTVIRDLALAR
jgi:hypothetical protein